MSQTEGRRMSVDLEELELKRWLYLVLASETFH